MKNSKEQFSICSDMGHKDGFYGKYGGFIISGLPLILMLINIILDFPDIFTQSGLVFELILSYLIILPVGFSAALSVKTKGLDLSFAAMAMITYRAFSGADTLLGGVVLALILCLAIGVMNSAAIHFLKLPGLLVTFVTTMLVSVLLNIIPRKDGSFEAAQSDLMPFILAVIAVVAAVFIAVISSRNTNRPFLIRIIPVYTGSGMLAFLYVFAHLFTERISFQYLYTPDLVVILLVIGVFLSVTRFSHNKTMALFLVTLPCLTFTIANNLYGFFILENITVYSIFILIMTILIFYMGRAQLAGLSREKSYRKKAWISMLPVWLWMAINVLLNSQVLEGIIAKVMPSMSSYNVQILLLYRNEMYKYLDIEFLLITAGLSVAYVFMNPREIERIKK